MLQDIELLENESILMGLRFPHKIQKVTQIVITAGRFSCLVDFHMWSLKAPAVALFLPGQVVESLETDEEFVGFGMVLSQDLTDSLNLPVSLQERLFIKNTQFYSVTEEGLDALSSVYRQVSRLKKQPDNPYREEIIRHLFSAHYYGLGYYMHGLQSQPSTLTLQQEKCEMFMSLVAENFKTHRDIGFYSDKLCVTSKYLSTMLKQKTGQSPLSYFNLLKIQQACFMLDETNMKVNQISAKLGINDAFYFSRLFCKIMGMCPKEYRAKKKG